MVLTYLQVFITGGIICVLGQILINLTKLTPARILVMFLLIGVLLEAIGVYKYITKFGGAGASVPITGFGAALAKGAIDGTISDGLLGSVSGGLEAVAVGISAVIFFAFVSGILASSKTK
ncbi:MAG: SpoVA/SpoVAEb family sporulation membrane protein [Christensenellaceae bacterium]|jgi:stage V sporulation protein AE|nr:SpoVA/SpoVAEb family sporulation membrane protein [Christensenellaceae bacterium]